jgi:hypothetical protein
MALANYVGLGILILICIAALVFSHIDVNGRKK